MVTSLAQPSDTTRLGTASSNIFALLPYLRAFTPACQTRTCTSEHHELGSHYACTAVCTVVHVHQHQHLQLCSDFLRRCCGRARPTDEREHCGSCVHILPVCALPLAAPHPLLRARSSQHPRQQPKDGSDQLTLASPPRAEGACCDQVLVV